MVLVAAPHITCRHVASGAATGGQGAARAAVGAGERREQGSRKGAR